VDIKRQKRSRQKRSGLFKEDPADDAAIKEEASGVGDPFYGEE
jgi:hypothetical protein